MPGRIARWMAVLVLGAGFATAQVDLRVEAAAAGVTEDQLAAVERQTQRAFADLLPAFAPMPAPDLVVFVHDDASSLPREVLAALHPHVAGVTLLGRDEVHLVLGALNLAPPHDLGTVAAHEVVHVLLDHWAGAASSSVPRWLHEGLAQQLTGRAYLDAAEEDLIFGANRASLPTFRELSERFPRRNRRLREAYAQSLSFVTYLRHQVGLDALLQSVRAIPANEGDYEAAFSATTGRRLIELEAEWLDYLVHRSGAGFRILLGSCFSLLLVVALPLVALASGRRLNRDRAVGERFDGDEDDPQPRDDATNP